MYSQILSVLGDVTARLGQVRDELVDAEAADTNRFIYCRRADVEPCAACEADAEEFSLMLRKKRVSVHSMRTRGSNTYPTELQHAEQHLLGNVTTRAGDTFSAHVAPAKIHLSPRAIPFFVAVVYFPDPFSTQATVYPTYPYHPPHHMLPPRPRIWSPVPILPLPGPLPIGLSPSLTNADTFDRVRVTNVIRVIQSIDFARVCLSTARQHRPDVHWQPHPHRATAERTRRMSAWPYRCPGARSSSSYENLGHFTVNL